VNLRGRNESRPVPELGRVSVRDFADDACIIARHLGKPAIVGHSMGGLVAQLLAAQDMVSAAALITPAPPRGIPLFVPGLMLKQLKYLPATLFSRALVPNREDLRVMVMNCLPRDRQDLLLDRVHPDSGRAAREMSITGIPVSRAGVQCPIRVVAASEDRFIPARIVARVAQRYDVPVETLQRHAHMVIAEEGWETLAESIADWLTVE
jgi:pimeloyl-ACP methyl ester carboxylesterase